MKIEEQKLNNLQKQQLNIPAVSGWAFHKTKIKWN